MDHYYGNWRDFPMVEWRWSNFSPQELASKGDGKLGIDERALDALQSLRDDLGRPLLITSAYRSPEHNARVGGARSSQHMKAIAFDVRMENHDPQAFEAAARRAGFSGFGFYPKSGFMHIDMGPEREWGKRWSPSPEVGLPSEPVRPPSSLKEDKVVWGVGLAGGGGIIGSIGPVLNGVGNLSPSAQVSLVLGGLALVAGLLYVFKVRR